ncbi:MAG: hypothetical protein E7157_03825 [Lactobacillales bacterium]|nr:hypothetical protein [Lactobacillales bacterium]
MKKVLKNRFQKFEFVLFLILFFSFCFFINKSVEAKKNFVDSERSISYNIKKGDKIEKVVGKNSKLSDFYLKLENVHGEDQITHPKVISFKKKWNGYKYWMAYTPYPYAEQAHENPHIMASNDLITWHTKKYFENPLDSVDEKNALKIYNSDTHLLYNPDTDRIECYWRYVDDIKGEVIIYKRTTRDGIKWTEKEEFLKAKRNQTDYLSPVVMYENKKYLVWYVDRDKTVKYIEYDKNEKKWTAPRLIDIKYDLPLLSWHLDVIKTDKGYEAILVAFDSWKNRGKMKLYYASSEDNIKWTKAKQILSTKNGGLYRSSILYLNNTYYIFYSEITRDNKRGVGMVYGTNINKLNGLKFNDIEKFKEFIKKNG